MGYTQCKCKGGKEMEPVVGFDTFRRKFKGYEDCYTIIGGTACTILMNTRRRRFRVTRDIDMIVLIEVRFEEFAALFWEFIREGGYMCGWKNSKNPHFYRFTEPKMPNYPVMIELFSRRPAFQADHPEFHLTPLPVSDEISSLSAIMLDDDYYRLMLEGRRIVDGIPVLGTEYLILFKMKAWLDLQQKKAQGIHVNDRDLNKHKNDVFRLYDISDEKARIAIPPVVMMEVEQFISEMTPEVIKLEDLKLEYTLEEAKDTLGKMFFPESQEQNQ